MYKWLKSISGKDNEIIFSSFKESKQKSSSRNTVYGNLADVSI